MIRNYFFITLISIFLLGCGNKSHDALPLVDIPNVSGSSILFPAKSPTVKRLLTAPVVSAQDNVLALPGRIVWDEDHTIRIMPPLAGRLTEALKAGTLGAVVKANETLAYLLSADFATAQAEFNTAQAALVQSEKNESRLKELFSLNGVSARDLEQAETDLVRARAEADRTALHMKAIGVIEDKDQRYAVRTPIAGVVVERNTNPGMEWRPDQANAALFVVSDPGYLWCWIDAPEYTLGMLHTGMKVTIHSSAWPKEIFNAQIDYIGDALDPDSRTVKVRAHLRNPTRHLKGEMYVTAELTSPSPGVLDVPAKAVFLNNNEQQVFVKNSEGLFTRKTITPVAFNDQWVSISEGLNKDDEVVTDGALYLEKLLEDGHTENTASESHDLGKPNS